MKGIVAHQQTNHHGVFCISEPVKTNENYSPGTICVVYLSFYHAMTQKDIFLDCAVYIEEEIGKFM